MGISACGSSQSDNNSATTEASTNEQPQPASTISSEEEVELPSHLTFSPPKCPITVEQASQLMEEPMVVFGGMTSSLSCQFNAESGPDYLQIVWTEPEPASIRAEELTGERSSAIASGIHPTTPSNLGARAVESRGASGEGEFQDIIYWELKERVIYVITQGPPSSESKVVHAATYVAHALE
ncbi:MAG TPA: hypothetical protein VFN89_12805 [Solirubrobacterales bacterium]|nr:hypothetical protein [Solirubrobacterales bacterium]